MSPSRIGYWARNCGLNLTDILADEDLSQYVASRDAQEQFKFGWSQADQELRVEKLAELKGHLREK